MGNAVGYSFVTSSVLMFGEGVALCLFESSSQDSGEDLVVRVEESQSSFVFWKNRGGFSLFGTEDLEGVCH